MWGDVLIVIPTEKCHIFSEYLEKVHNKKRSSVTLVQAGEYAE